MDHFKLNSERTGRRAKILTLEQIAQRLQVPGWKIQRLFERKLLPETARAGRARVFAPSQVPAIRRALIKAGYLRRGNTK